MHYLLYFYCLHIVRKKKKKKFFTLLGHCISSSFCSSAPHMVHKKKKASTILGHCLPSSFRSSSLRLGFDQIASLWKRKGTLLYIIIK
jgi:hypothetical protein